MTLRHPFYSFGLCALLSACSGLPQDVARPVSHALESPASTALGTAVQQRQEAAQTRHASGFLLLSGPDDAFGSRLALTEAAEKTLDLQYYAIHADASAARLLRRVVAAARRGVRVRVLLDDFHSTGRDAQVMRLAFEPNIEMRMFNPVAGPRASKLGRIASAVFDFSRAQQRMHNKLYIADNAMGITGGRNLGDAYFGNAEAGNFVDLDILAAGPIVADLSRSFDSYWNNERAFPVQALISKEDLLKMREEFRAEDAAQADEPADSAKAKASAASEAAAASSTPKAAAAPASAPPTKGELKAEQSQRAAQFKAMDLKTAKFVWAPAVVLVDKPAKIAAEGAGSATPQDNPQDNAAASPSAPALVLASSNSGEVNAPAARPAPPSQAPAARTPREAVAAVQHSTPQSAASAPQAPIGDTVVDGLLQLMGQAEHDLLIVSPYFVPGNDIMKAFAEARSRKVRVRVLTNSLASNDAPIAHAGYAGYRKALLDLGVELYEMRSEVAGLRSAMGLSGSGSSATGSSRAMLHSKVLVMDGRLLVIGSMNLDLRSELQNTEVALLIRSRKLSQLASTQIETGLRNLAWHVEQDDQGLVWHAPEDSELGDMRHEPDTSFMLRLLMRVLGPLAPDHLL